MQPYEIKLGGLPFWVVDKPQTRSEYLFNNPKQAPDRLGLIAIGAFREQSYVDYVAVCYIDDDETENWTAVHEQYEWLDWMAGVVYSDRDRQKQLRDTERTLGKFLGKHGFAPDYVLETAPSQDEMDAYVQHVMDKDTKGGQLIMPSDNE